MGTFPDRASVLRLVGAVLAETHDEWADTRRYMSVDALLRPDPLTETKELLLEQAAQPHDEDDDGSARRLVHHLDRT